MNDVVPNVNSVLLRHALNAFYETGAVMEIRIPDCRMVTTNGRPDPRTGTYSGYFDHPERCAPVLEKSLAAADFSGVYVTLNPVPRDIASRSYNRLKFVGRKDATTADKDIDRRHRLLIDCDPNRPSGISSTEEEKESAYDKAIQVRGYLCSRGWPEPILGDSGNGWHLIYSIDLPAADTTVPAILQVLSGQFSDEKTKIDTTVGNPARICKLYGTAARKGDSTPDRPHRMSRIVYQPENLVIVPADLLAELAAEKKAPAPPTTTSSPSPASFDLDGFVARHFPDAEPKEWNGGTRWPLAACVFDPSHVGGSAAIMRSSSGVISYRCQHDGCSGRRWKDVRDLLEPKPVAEPDYAVIVTLSDVQPEEVSWCWYHRAAHGKITVIDGDPGLGKSMLSIDLVACVTTGAPLPGGGHYGPADVVIMTAEDGLADTVLPRLLAAGGDATRVTALTAIRAKGRERFPSLLRDVAMLEAVVLEKKAKVVIIDPLMAFLAGSDAHKDQDIRAALAPVAAMAERTGAAVLVIRHLNKGQGSQAIYRGGGSIGITGAARAVFLVAKDPQDDTRRIVACVKNNLAPMPPALAYTIVGVNGGSARLRWDPRPVEITADQLLAAGIEAAAGKGSAVDEAEKFLRDRLKEGPKLVTDLKSEAGAAGIRPATLRRAQKKLNVQHEKQTGKTGRWEWKLIQGGEGEQGAQGAQDLQGGQGEHLVPEPESFPAEDSEHEGEHVARLVNVEHLEHVERLTGEPEENPEEAPPDSPTAAPPPPPPPTDPNPPGILDTWIAEMTQRYGHEPNVQTEDLRAVAKALREFTPARRAEIIREYVWSDRPDLVESKHPLLGILEFIEGTRP
jgi:hypothetical protein